MSPAPSSALELWGGVECSVVRVGDAWRDQIRETGHEARGVADIDRIAELGIRTLRYPLLWERSLSSEKLAWEARQVAALDRRGITVIGGLVHHGSGPAGTHLLDPEFPEKLARYAAEAARRHPSVQGWTPVNEPLTTARFSCLYGHWYPHERDEGAFLRALVHQCRAAMLSMRAIRSTSPRAWFVHTEDIGKVFSTQAVADQAGYENARRWLSLDLLCGRVDRHHPLRGALEASGVPAAQLDEMQSGEAAPDIIGFNHYATSDRYLDHRLDLYPASLRGGNGRQAYVDTEAVRVDLSTGHTGMEARLRETWTRYGLPIAVTEAHLGCEDPHEQIRWLMEAWHAAETLRQEGADIRAVTAWALFGLVDWDSMLRERRGHYEAGAFDVSADPPCATLLAEAVGSLARRGRYDHPALHEAGWWRRAERIHASLQEA